MTPPIPSPRELSRGASFAVAAAVVAHTLWTSAAPAVTYPLYAALWHLTPTVTTGMFAVYPVTVVLALLLFGSLSDRVGRRLMMILGVASSLMGVGLFAIAPGVGWLYAARALMGLGVGLSTGPATAALVEFGGAGHQGRANVVATAATAFGMGMATLAGGALIQYAPWPLHLNFVVLAAVLGVLLAFCWVLPRPSSRPSLDGWRPGTVAVPRALLPVFVTAATAVTAGYAMGALVLSLGTQIARDLIGSGNALVNGAALTLFAVAAAATALLARRMPGAPTIAFGGVASVAGLALLTFAAHDRSLPQFLGAVALAGAGYSLSFLGGLTLINAHAPAHHRAGTLSAIYLVGYLTMGVIALSLGIAATHRGLAVALALGAPAIGALAVAATLLALVRVVDAVVGPVRRRRPGRQVEIET